ncbi:MAG: DUF4886 domain-containing protein [Clostridia bacterium]|nr:DUF4886 domain-containing protein [Clostridia bacterium]
MNILAIGNSFSQDATRYLEDIARASGEKLSVASLYIGGCSLEKHFRNFYADNKTYELIWNGSNTGFFVTIKEALLSRAWDVVTLQQQSLQSADFETFEPYLSYLCKEIRTLCPKSKIYMYETWGYANATPKLETTKYSNHTEMYLDIKKSYKQASERIDADGIIPCGELINRLHAEKGLTVHRDGFHLSYGLGRYAAGLVWFKTLFGKMPSQISADRLDAEVSLQELDTLWKELEK